MHRNHIVLLSGTALLLCALFLFVRRPSAPPLRPAEPAPESIVAPTPTNAPALPPAPVIAPTQSVVKALPPPPPPPVAKEAVRPAPPAPVRRLTGDPNVPKHCQILLSNRRIVVPDGRSFPKRFSAAQTPTARQTAPYLLVALTPVNRDVRLQAVANGAKVVGFMPNNALLVEADAETLDNLTNDPHFIAAVEYEPMDKLQPGLLTGNEEELDVRLTLFNAADRDRVRALVMTEKGRLAEDVPDEPKVLSARLPRKAAITLAGHAEIRWIARETAPKVSACAP